MSMLRQEHWKWEGMCFDAWGDLLDAYFQRHGHIEDVMVEVEWCDFEDCTIMRDDEWEEWD